MVQNFLFIFLYHTSTIYVPYKPSIPSMCHLCTICVWYNPSISSMYGTKFFIFFFCCYLCMVQLIHTIQTIHTICVWYKIFLNFFSPSAYGTIHPYHLCTIQTAHTIHVPSVYHTIYLYHLCIMQKFFEIFSSLVKK